MFARLLQSLTTLGITPEMSPALQRKIIITNYLILILFAAVSGMAFIFLSQQLYLNVFIINIGHVALLGIFALNYYGKIDLSRILVCILPPIFLTFISVYTKIVGATNNLVFVFGPRTMLLFFSLFPLILLNLEKRKYLFFAMIPGLICVFLFEELHAVFGIKVYDLPIGENTQIFKFIYLIVYLVINSLIYSTQNLNQIYERKTQFLLNETSLQNQHIKDSIKYAQRIQMAIIGAKEIIVKSFEDAFVFFSPKDIVSGDFYWYGEEDNKKIVIAADCTGHGVPGALMTVMGNDFINEIVHFHKITSPADILQALDKKVIQALQKENNHEKRDDGMDIAILTFEDNRLTFAAAKNPLYWVRNNEMNQIKGDVFPIGSAKYKTEKVFTQHHIEAQKGDVFYLFSDGFQDQFGGENDKKYMTKRFREYLLSISQQKMSIQENLLKEELDKWKNHQPQTDDILIIGIKY